MPTEDNICRTAIIACNVDPVKAGEVSKIGALRNLFTNNRRIQIIWRTYVGGNHHDHIHIGIRARKADDPKDRVIQEVF